MENYDESENEAHSRNIITRIIIIIVVYFLSKL
jgi:hypothetical protein